MICTECPRLSRSLKVTSIDTDRSATCEFHVSDLTVLMDNAHSCYRSTVTVDRFQDKRRFRWKNAILFPLQCMLLSCWGFPWNFVLTVSPKTEILKKFDDAYKRFDTIPVCYRLTDGRNWNNNIALCMLSAIKSRLQTFSCVCRRYPATAANGNITQAADTAPLVVAGAASGPRCFEAYRLDLWCILLRLAVAYIAARYGQRTNDFWTS